MKPLTMTPLRLKVLRFLADKPNGYSVKGIVHECCPRPGYRDGTPGPRWTQQGAARMSGKVCGPLEAAGLIRYPNPFAPTYDKDAAITDAGRALLAQREKAASDAERDAAIRSGA